MGFMAPSNDVLATKLMTSSESKSAYKLQKKVQIADNANVPIMFSDRGNENEPIIDYNRLLSTVDIELPESIILYSSQSKEDNVKSSAEDTTKNNENKEETEDNCLLSDSFWQKQFETKAHIQKHYVLQNNNVKYRDLQFEYDQYLKCKTKSDQEPLLQKLLKNKSHQIQIKSSNHFKNVVAELKASNPELFKDDKNANDDENVQQFMLKNLRRLTGYDEIDETELLAINPANFNASDSDSALSDILQQNQCNFENDIIIDDEYGWNSNESDINECIQEQLSEHEIEDGDIQMAHPNESKSSVEHKVVELKPMSYIFFGSFQIE